ncbi:MAG TPA: hypothetical protein PLB92_11175 [Rhodoglobus sp.]|nr:hypothetical protein [Rhodoglobus sp.]
MRTSGAADGERSGTVSKGSSGGSGGAGVLFVFVVVLIAAVPKEVWIALGALAAFMLVCWIASAAIKAAEQRRAEAEERARVERAAQAAAAKRDREEWERREKQSRIDLLGHRNAVLMESALSAVKEVAGSEAARAGWLGDIDFSADIAGIADGFAKAHALSAVTGKLSVLDKPSADDRRLLAEARTTIANLEGAAHERVALIVRCATEAHLIDESLRTEREDARVAEQRAELHGKLSAMLYGIEATPEAAPTDSAVEAVMARVQAYREIKSQIERARDTTP